MALVRSGYEAASRGDLEGAFAHVSPEVEWRWAGRPLRGIPEIRRAIQEGWAFIELRLEIQHIALLTPERVVAYVHQYSRWTEQAVEGKPGEGLWSRRLDLWTFNGDLAIRYEQYFPVEGLLEFAKRDSDAATDPERRRRWWQNVMRRAL